MVSDRFATSATLGITASIAWQMFASNHTTLLHEAMRGAMAQRGAQRNDDFEAARSSTADVSPSTASIRYSHA